ncbi:MAG: flagellar hook-length control protein FliK [Lachnospiraceae bacterium]|nr:flagellar hook-length control protein FliK [Lachnospiraceae bacterium]
MTTTKAMESANLFASRNYSKSEAKTEKNDMFSQFLDVGSLKTSNESSLSKTSIVSVAKNKLTTYDTKNSDVENSTFETKETAKTEYSKTETVEKKQDSIEDEEKIRDDKTSNETKDTMETKDDVKSDNKVDESVEEPLDKKILKLSNELKEKLCAALDISLEELNELLAKSQLTVLSLFNQTSLMEFSMVVSGTQDMSQILTNEDALKVLQTISKVVNEVDVEQFTGINKEEFGKLVSDVLEGNFNANDINKNQDNQTQINAEDVNKVDDAQVQILEQDNVSEEVLDDNLNKSNLDGQSVSRESVSDEKSLVIDVEETNQSKGQHTDSNNNDNNNASTSLDAFAENLTAALNQTAVTKEVSFAGQIAHVREVKQVIDQIVTQIKVTVTKDTQSIQMQLNPENLGRVNMTITSKNGVMTAQFIVESEAAKEAIEGQIRLLIDNLNDQGLKVEELEVTTRQFSFNQQESSDSGAGQNSKSKKSFATTDFFADEITQTEEAEIVRENSTVSYMA